MPNTFTLPIRPRRLRLLMACAATGALTFGATVAASPAAHASPVGNYATIVAPAICASLDQNPTVANVGQILTDVMRDSGFGAYEAGQIVGASVAVVCPRNQPVIDRFIQTYAPNGATSNHIGQLSIA